MLKRKWVSSFLCLLALLVLIAPAASARRNHARQRPMAPLTAHGRELAAQYASMLRQLQSEIAQALPTVDPGLQKPFMDAYKAESQYKWTHSKKHTQFKELDAAIAKCMQKAGPVLSIVNPVLSSSALDAKLIKASVLANGTPHGLAAFAQQSSANEQLIDKLLSDPALMRQMQIADGPQNGNYGLTMQIYTAIQQASSEAHDGILQRLAMGTALMQKPMHAAYNKDAVQFNPVKRFLDYQKAYDHGVLDPNFPIMTTWECRFITNDPFSDAEIDWFRQMLQNYEPSYITMTNHVRRYLEIVHTDVGYCHPNWDIVPGSLAGKLLAGGGECGPRAWFGRLADRSFGIPVWGVRQPGHAAMSHWTPTGWVTHLGAGWEWSYWNTRDGLDFHLETQARWHQKAYMSVLRAQWIGETLGEEKADGSVPGSGGFWAAVANCEKRAIVASGKPTRVIPSENQLAKMFGPTKAQMMEAAPVPASATQIVVNHDGVIHVPAIAMSRPTRDTRTIRRTRSFLGGGQIHYGRAKRPEAFEYTVNAPSSGNYLLTARIVTVNPKQHLLLTVNGKGKATDIALPWTDGMWQKTKPVQVTLVEGRNLLHFERNTDYLRGVTIKDFTLTPVK